MKLKRMLQTVGMNLQKGSAGRGRYLKKKKICAEVGDFVRFQPRVIPLYPELIRLHNNITIAAGVRFVTHDAVHTVLNRLDRGRFPEMVGCIEVMDNVFIGANSTIMPNVRIGSNVIIGANSVVNRDCEPNSVYAGIPAKRLGSFEDFVEKREKRDYPSAGKNQNISEVEIANAWACFDSNRNQ